MISASKLRDAVACLAITVIAAGAALADDADLQARLTEKVDAIETAWAIDDYQTLLDRQMDAAVVAIAASNGMSTETFRKAFPSIAKAAFGALDPMLPYFDTDAATFLTLADGRNLALVRGAYVYGLNGQLLQHELTSVWLLVDDDWRFAEVNDVSSQTAILSAFSVLTREQLPFSEVVEIDELPEWAGDAK